MTIDDIPAKELEAYRKAYPDLPDEELFEVWQTLQDYLGIVIRIVRRRMAEARAAKEQVDDSI